MDVSFSPQEEAFRKEVQDFIAETLPTLGKISRHDFTSKGRLSRLAQGALPARLGGRRTGPSSMAVPAGR